jgi:hypothetical protein
MASAAGVAGVRATLDLGSKSSKCVQCGEPDSARITRHLEVEQGGHVDGKRPLLTCGLDDAVYTKYLGHPVSLFLFRLPASLLPITFTGQGLFDPEFLARLQVEGVPFDFADDVLLNNLPLETAERVLNRLAVLEPYLSQTAPPSRPESSGDIIRLLPASEPLRPAPTFPSVPCRA